KGTKKALAMTLDGPAYRVARNPREGAKMAVAEACRNIVCSGGRPLAATNCLNFGNPEHPEVMWQFAEVVDGMAGACRDLGLPVIGGNVSFYNESGGEDIQPTPVVGVVGLIDRLDSPVPAAALAPGTRIVLLGDTAAELGGSEWAAAGVHDCSDGGLAVALAEMAIAGGCGFEVRPEGSLAGLVPAVACFS